MRTLFAVTRSKGHAWDASKPMRSQTQWEKHAEFMDGLAASGFVVLGGPIGYDGDVLLILIPLMKMPFAAGWQTIPGHQWVYLR